MLYRAIFLYGLLFLLLFASVSAEEPRSAAPKNLVFEMNWIPQAEYAGHFVAKEKGFFRKYLKDRDVDIIWKSPTHSASNAQAAPETDFFSAFFSDACAERVNRKTPIVCIAQISPGSPLMLVTRKNTGIRTPYDLNGREIQVWRGGSDAMLNAFFNAYDVKPILVKQGGSMIPFITGVVPVASAMIHNEYHMLLEHGMKEEELQTFPLADYGFNNPGNGIYCTIEFREKNPELCYALVEACRDGWEFAVNPKNEAEVLDIVMAYADKAKVITNRNHQRWMLRIMRDYVDLNKWGHLSRTDYFRVGKLLVEQKVIPEVPEYDDFYRPAIR